MTSGNQLISFAAGSSTASTSVPITGLKGQVVVGIDFRPSDLAHVGSPNNIGVLYAVATGNVVCRIQVSTGIVQRCFRLATAEGTPVVLSGTSFGVGFNPAVDRLRVHSNADQNLRINVDNGVTIVDGPLGILPAIPMPVAIHRLSVPGTRITMLMQQQARSSMASTRTLTRSSSSDQPVLWAWCRQPAPIQASC